MSATNPQPDLVARHGLAVAGAPLASARLVVLCLHGRGADAADIIGLGAALGASDVAYLAPSAAAGAWYPMPFTRPVEDNEPSLSAALGRIDAILSDLEAVGVPANRRVLAGFSQGACLSLEYAARHPGKVAAVLGLSGGMIGASVPEPQSEDDLAGLAVFLGCSMEDPFIPASRVRETEAHLKARGAAVTMKFYPQPGHGINADEIAEARRLLEGLNG